MHKIVMHLVIFQSPCLWVFYSTSRILVAYLSLSSRLIFFNLPAIRGQLLLWQCAKRLSREESDDCPFYLWRERHVHNHNICSRKEERSAWVPTDRCCLPGTRARTGGMRHDSYRNHSHRWRSSDHGCPILLHRHAG